FFLPRAQIADSRHSPSDEKRRIEFKRRLDVHYMSDGDAMALGEPHHVNFTDTRQRRWATYDILPNYQAIPVFGSVCHRQLVGLLGKASRYLRDFTGFDRRVLRKAAFQVLRH